MIMSGQLARDQALTDMMKSPYDEKLFMRDKAFVMKKFNLSSDDFSKYMKAQIHHHMEYPSLTYWENKILRFGGRVLRILHLIKDR
jgi:hypothetical protein